MKELAQFLEIVLNWLRNDRDFVEATNSKSLMVW